MHPIVKSSFRGFNEPFEGVVPFMYLDIKGLVTVGVGNLIDPIELALELPFRSKSDPGHAATPEEITAEWTRLKNDLALAKRGHRACGPITSLELSDSAIDDLITRRLLGQEKILKRQPQFAAFEDWPADAQLALLSMAWAMGPGGPSNFKKFSASCLKLDFKGAAAECQMSEVGNPGVAPRNRANKTLFENAHEVISGKPAAKLERALLYFPKVLSKPARG